MATKKASAGTAKKAGTSTAKKTTTRASTATKGTSASRASQDGSATRAPAKRAPRDGASAPRASAPKKKSGMAIAAVAARQLLEMTGRDAEGVVGLEKTEDGWRVEVEVLEVRRIPETTDVLALYELTVDGDGDLEGYRRLRRYTRGAAGQESR